MMNPISSGGGTRQSADRVVDRPWSELLREFPQQRFALGDEILVQGRVAVGAFVLGSGIVKLVHTSRQGRASIMGIRGRGSILGSAAVLLGTTQAATVVALSPCELTLIPAGTFSALIQEGGEFSWRIHIEHCRELRRRLEHSAGLAYLSARERLEEFFQLLSEEIALERAGDGAVALPLRDWELAQFLAVTPPYLSRLLNELLCERRLAKRAGRWFLLGPSGLRAT
jgi:CRP-like cAMP-binding protein